MSNKLREIVELTSIKGMTAKCILLHMADTVRADLLFWRSKSNVAKRLGTDPKTIRRNFSALANEGLIVHVGKKRTANGSVNVYRVNLAALLALSCIEAEDTRRHKAVDLGRGSEPRGEGLRALGVGTESPTSHIEPYTNHESAEKGETPSNVSQYARDSSNVVAMHDRLADDPEAQAFFAEKAALAQKGKSDA